MNVQLVTRSMPRVSPTSYKYLNTFAFVDAIRNDIPVILPTRDETSLKSVHVPTKHGGHFCLNIRQSQMSLV